MRREKQHASKKGNDKFVCDGDNHEVTKCQAKLEEIFTYPFLLFMYLFEVKRYHTVEKLVIMHWFSFFF